MPWFVEETFGKAARPRRGATRGRRRAAPSCVSASTPRQVSQSAGSYVRDEAGSGARHRSARWRKGSKRWRRASTHLPRGSMRSRPRVAYPLSVECTTDGRVRARTAAPQPRARRSRSSAGQGSSTSRSASGSSSSSTSGAAHPILWIAGPPGSGKSTLVASYIESRKAPGLWFQADPGDADPATFFHYVRVGVGEIPGRRARDAAALPVFSAEYAGDLPAFSRRFMRELFGAVSRGLDPGRRQFPRAQGRRLVEVRVRRRAARSARGHQSHLPSREPPVPEMARLVGEQRITRIEWEALRFTTEETQALTATAQLAPDVARAIHKASDGWAAGIVLMREHVARNEGRSRRKRSCRRARRRSSSISPARSSGARGPRTSAC